MLGSFIISLSYRFAQNYLYKLLEDEDSVKTKQNHTEMLWVEAQTCWARCKGYRTEKSRKGENYLAIHFNGTICVLVKIHNKC